MSKRNRQHGIRYTEHELSQLITGEFEMFGGVYIAVETDKRGFDKCEFCAVECHCPNIPKFLPECFPASNPMDMNILFSKIIQFLPEES